MVFAGCVKSITELLNEVHTLEGINVDYDIAAFDDEYYPLTKENWLKQYPYHNGGTNILQAFTIAQNTLLKDQDVDGHRMVVLFTDGEVSPLQIDEIKKLILQHNSDVRCMIIGVGANATSRFVETVVGDLNILSSDMADVVLIKAISAMLEGGN